MKAEESNRTEPRPFFEEIPHTADWAIRVYGADLKALFANAARAMFQMMDAPFHQEPTVVREVELEDIDIESLLVSWLSELLFLQETEEELYTRFEIEDISDTRLKARIAGVKGRSPLAHIKAVTYHDLSVQRTPEGYEATVLFDT